jgi:RNA polymerase sigma factor for flagellar operon FliA
MWDECNRWQPPEQSPAAEAQLGEHVTSLVTAMATGMMSLPREGPDSIACDDADPEQATMRAELFARIVAALEQLPREEATIVRRHYLEGLQFDEVAAQLGLSKSWASRLHRRAIDRLSKLLEDEL